MNYQKAKKEITCLLSSEKNGLDLVVNYLYEKGDHYDWIGIYLVKDGSLHLGPWRGKQATEHTIIPIGQGICGAAAQTGNTEIVADVNKDNRYLSCFISTKSEIVIPIKKNSHILGEIDIDSDKPNAFTQHDKVFLEEIADMLSEHICMDL
jgi:GAF domain-containing protein